MNSSGKKILIVVLGPTASGKTSLSVQLAKHFQTEVISADSRQIFTELKIGTARPTKEELQGVVHHCLGHISIYKDYNAGKFETEALGVLEKIYSKNDVAIVCGGTGLYLKALLEGFDELPEKENAVRENIEKEYEEKGLIYLQNRLQELDPEFFRVIDQKNPQRLMRAIEIVELTGKTNAELRKGKTQERNFEVIKIGIETDRDLLYEKINARVDEMMNTGLAIEAKRVFPYRALNALQTVGYQELFDHFEGHSTLEEAVEKIKQHTRNYAKRQLTWFRRDTDIRWIKPEDAIALVEQEMKKINHHTTAD